MKPNQSPVVAAGWAALAIALVAVVGGTLVTGCAAQRSTSLVTLPAGDVAAGKTAFQDLMCYTCHRVVGSTTVFPVPTASPPVPVALGGEPVQPTRDQWVVSIVDPSHEIAPGYREELVAEGSLSRMGDYTHLLTVRQLADLVAFLESLHSRPLVME